MYANIIPATSCSVTKEYVEYVADLSPTNLRDKMGNAIIPAVLFVLGFEIDFGESYNSFYTIYDVYVRSSKSNHKVYKTTVYNGKVRKHLNDWNYKTNRPVYDKSQYHILERKYANHEVLNIGDVDDELLSDISEIGSILLYNKGLEEKVVNTDKSNRNIVRN